MQTFKKYFNLVSLIAGLLLLIMGAVHGIVGQDYPRACFELLLAYGCDWSRV